jgi:hypothetical protein
LAQWSLVFAATAIPALAQATWDNRTALITGGVNNNAGFAYNGSRFLMVTSTATYWRSVAGTSNWTFSSFSFPTTSGSLSIAHGAGATLVAGSNNVLMRTTAANPATADWVSQRPITRSNGTMPSLFRARHLNNQFVIGSAPYNDNENFNANSYSELITSIDGGLTWTSRKFMASTLTNATFDLRDVAFKPGATAGNGTYVFTTNTNTVLVAPESLASATRVNITASGSDTAHTVTFGAGVFVAITGNGKIFTSPTGAAASWTLRSTPVTAGNSWNDIHFDGTTFIVVGGTVTGSSPARPAILQSTDGITWTEATSVPATNQLLISAFRGDGLWLVGGGTRTLFTSGSSSVAAPSFTSQPANFGGAVGGTITLTATASGTPTPTYQWFRNDSSPVALEDDARISGATTPTLTITGSTYADAKNYYLVATNAVGPTNSNVATVALNFAGGGAVLSPYGINNSGGGTLIPGASPAAALTGGFSQRFQVGSGATSLPNTFVNSVSYGLLGGLSPDGTKAVLNSNNSNPPLIYTLATNSGTQMPLPVLPLGPITSITFFNATGIANNGDVTGQLQRSLPTSPFSQNHAFHYSAATQTYTLLGNVPNTGNDIASNTGGISADGTVISGYERTGSFNGAFVWTTTGGFTLLPQPSNGSIVNGDIRGISPNGRYIVGFGGVGGAFGSGSTAMRWDRGSPAGAPVGFALPRRLTDTFGDAFAVNDDGTTVGSVRLGSSFNQTRAAVWLPSGALIVLPDYLTATYGLNLTGFTLTEATSISTDRRTIAGTALLPDSSVQGWILTLPAPVDAPATPEIVVRQNTTEIVNNGTVTVGTAGIGAPSPVQTFMRVLSLGGAPLTGITATIGGPDAADFFYVPNGGNPGDPLPTSLGINEGAMFDLRFAPTAGATGARTATLTITSNDSDESLYVINLQGTAVTPTTQTITFNQPPDRLATDAPFVLSATSTSGFFVSFALISGPATLFGTTVTLTGAPGTVVVEARQTGSATVLAATPVSRSFSVTGPDPLADFLTNAGVPANLRGPNDDPDGDNLDNLLEYALDLNPNGSGGAFSGTPPALSTTPTQLQLTYRRVRNDVTYVVQSATTLSGPWSTGSVTQGTQAGDGTITASIPITPGSQFLRLSVTR